MPVYNDLNNTKHLLAEKANNVGTVTSPDVTPAAGANPTKAEFDAVVTLLNETKAKLNALLAEITKTK